MYQSKGEDTIKILCIQKSEGTLISSDFFDRIDTREDYMMRKVLFLISMVHWLFMDIFQNLIRKR